MGHRETGHWSILDIFAVAIEATTTIYRCWDEVAIVVVPGYGMTVARFQEFWSPIEPGRQASRAFLPQRLQTTKLESRAQRMCYVVGSRPEWIVRRQCTYRAPPATISPAFCALAVEHIHIVDQVVHRDTVHGTDRCSKPKRTYHRPHDMNGLTYHRDPIHEPCI